MQCRWELEGNKVVVRWCKVWGDEIESIKQDLALKSALGVVSTSNYELCCVVLCCVRQKIYILCV